MVTQQKEQTYHNCTNIMYHALFFLYYGALPLQCISMVYHHTVLTATTTVYHYCTPHVPLLYTTCTIIVHHMYHYCTPHVPLLYTTCTIIVHHMYHYCTPHVPLLYTTCTIIVHHMYHYCTPHVPLLYIWCTIIVHMVYHYCTTEYHYCTYGVPWVRGIVMPRNGGV